MESVLFNTSLIAAFIAGMVALFAPCCITFLLPAYLGSVFKEKEKVLLMTLVFGLGIFIVLLPAVLGIAFISTSLFRYHDTVYLVGGIAMLIVSLVTLLGIKLPMIPLPERKVGGKVDVFSIFTLGIFSGLTSACCAPVLIGILTLTFLSFNFFGAILLGVMYVLGMVTPLLIISLFLSGKMPKTIILKKPLLSLRIFSKEYFIILNNLIAAAIFFTTGVLTLGLTLTGRLSMEKMGGATKVIQNVGEFINSMVGPNMFFNILFMGLVAYFLYRISKKI